MKRNAIFFKNNELDQENKLKFCLKNKDRDWRDVLIIYEFSFYHLTLGKDTGVGTKISTNFFKNFMNKNITIIFDESLK